MNDLFPALFEPRRIALIGASADERKTTSRPQRFLAKHGFTGEILPVNPGRAEIFAVKAYKNLDAIRARSITPIYCSTARTPSMLSPPAPGAA